MRLAGVPIEMMIEYCALMQQGNSTITSRKELLVEECTKLIKRIGNTTKTLDRLNYKIDGS